MWHLVQARASPRQVSKVIWRIPIGRSEVTSQGQTGYGGHRTRWTPCWWFAVSNRITSLVLERKQPHKNGETSSGLNSMLTSYMKIGPLIFLFKFFLRTLFLFGGTLGFKDPFFTWLVYPQIRAWVWPLLISWQLVWQDDPFPTYFFKPGSQVFIHVISINLELKFLRLIFCKDFGILILLKLDQDHFGQQMLR